MQWCSGFIFIIQSPHHIWSFAMTWIAARQSPCPPLSLRSPPALNLSQPGGLFQWVSSLHQVAKVLEFQLQHQSLQWIFGVDFLQDWSVCSPCCQREFQESFPEPQFENINSLVLSLLYGPTFTSIHDCWKSHNFYHMIIFWQNDVSAF